jgi:putative flavoprotein involved in K+ transport
MLTTHTLIIGAGQAGLAMSRHLTDAGIDHVILERGRTGERWHGERWDSLRLLSPNWCSRLPDWQYDGPEPDGFMTAGEFASYLDAYADSFAAPVEQQCEVLSLTHDDDAFIVGTTDATWRANNVVIATGWCDEPYVPPMAQHLHPAVEQLTASDYHNPDAVPDGLVLVVGASASGVQIADELVRAGRDVVVAAGRHSRLPRRYRGLDIFWWLEQIGTFAATIDGVADPRQARAEGALQLIGRDDYRNVDLPALQRLGVRIGGRLARIDGRHLILGDNLDADTQAADERLQRILGQIDRHIDANGLRAEVLPPGPPPAPLWPERVRRLDVGRDGVAAVVWATGYRRRYRFLDVPVRDASGEIVHQRGVTAVDGLFVIGQRFQYRRDSNFIDGVRHDAAYLANYIAEHRCCPEPATNGKR